MWHELETYLFLHIFMFRREKFDKNWNSSSFNHYLGMQESSRGYIS